MAEHFLIVDHLMDGTQEVHTCPLWGPMLFIVSLPTPLLCPFTSILNQPVWTNGGWCRLLRLVSTNVVVWIVVPQHLTLSTSLGPTVYRVGNKMVGSLVPGLPLSLTYEQCFVDSYLGSYNWA